MKRKFIDPGGGLTASNTKNECAAFNKSGMSHADFVLTGNIFSVIGSGGGNMNFATG